jgi:hypothetical protein
MSFRAQISAFPSFVPFVSFCKAFPGANLDDGGSTEGNEGNEGKPSP